jgi:ATP-dependent DNA helicase RecG
MITETKISSAQLAYLLAKSEGHFLDFKAKEITPAKLTRSLSAFANGDGGELFIGISSKSGKIEYVWDGFTNQEEANGMVQCFESFFPLGQDVTYEFLTCDGQKGLVLRAEIRKTGDIKTATDQNVYIRRGAQNFKLEGDGPLERLRLNKGIKTFETETVGCDSRFITNSAVLIAFLLEVVPTAEPDTWLRKQQLLRDDKPTVAGVVLFAEEPQGLLPKRCGIKIYRYKTTEKQGTRDTLVFDPISIEGDVYNQIYGAVTKTKDVVEEIKKLGDEELEDVQYPTETLHEIITNAVLHRDYSLTDDVHVRVFDNRVEVESPGKLPAHITPQNILEERFARNPSIVRLINKFKNAPNKDVGEGLNTAFQAMRKLKLKDPEIIQRENSVLVIIKHQPLASPEETILEYLDIHAQINNSTAREICFIGSENKMKRILQRMVEKGLLETVPELKGNKTAYQRVKK